MVNIVMAFKISIARLLPYLNMRESSSPPPQSNSTSDVCDEIKLIQKIFVLMHYDRPKDMRPNDLCSNFVYFVASALCRTRSKKHTAAAAATFKDSVPPGM